MPVSESLECASESSRFAEFLRRSAAGSRVVSAVRQPVLDQPPRQSSSVLAWIETVAKHLERLQTGSKTAALTHTVVTAVVSSYLFQWLTSEPDPEVVVIDLREVWTVRPVLEVIDRMVDAYVGIRPFSRAHALATEVSATFEAAPVRTLGYALIVAVAVSTAVGLLAGSLAADDMTVALVLIGLGVLGTRVEASMQELRNTRTAELLITILEPPEVETPDSGQESGADGANAPAQEPLQSER
jgi:hypothetical protein